MRYTGETIQHTIRKVYAEHRKGPTSDSALRLAKLRALRALYETTVYARVEVPGGTKQQRSLREVTELYRLLTKTHSSYSSELKRLRVAIWEARKVPVDLPEIDFTA